VLKVVNVWVMSAQRAAKCLCEEVLEKVEQGSARVVKWTDICDELHPNLKISPLAAVPHKSRVY